MTNSAFTKNDKLFYRQRVALKLFIRVPLFIRGKILNHANIRFLKIIFVGLAFIGCERTQFPAHHLFYPTKKPVSASPLVVDLNRDGKLEIAISSFTGEFYVLDDSLRVLASWPQLEPTPAQNGRGFYSSAVAWDVDNDDHPELFVGSENGKLIGWQLDSLTGAPMPVKNFPVELGGLVWSSPTISADSLIAIGGHKKMFMFDRQGRPVAGWPQPIKGWTEATAAWHDDLIAITTLMAGETSRGHLYAWHLNGVPYANFPINLKMDSNTSPALADLDNDGRAEIIVGDDAGLLHVFTRDGSELPGFPRLAGSRIESSPTVVDLDGNGMLDIIVGAADGYVYAWNSVGDILLGWPVKTNDEVRSSPSIADIDGDGGLTIIIGSMDNFLYAFNSDGSLAPGFPIDCGNKISTSAWIGDLDGDGKSDIVVGADNGVHRLCNLGKLGAVPWPMFRRDIRHTGTAAKF